MDELIFENALREIKSAIEMMKKDEKNYPVGNPKRPDWVKRYNALTNARRALENA